MKNIVCRIAVCALMFVGCPLGVFADEAAKEPSFFEKLGNNIWYIVLVIAFSAGLIIITKWSSKIKERDAKLKEEYDEWKKEHPEAAERFENGEEPQKEEETEEAPEEDPANDGEAAENGDESAEEE